MLERRTAVTLATMLVTLVAIELALHTRRDSIPEPLEFFSEQAQDAARDLDRLAAAGIRSDLVFVGTSMVGLGIRTPIFEQRLESVEHAHNARLSGSRTPMISEWVFDFVLPTVEPRRVVWGISTLDFSPLPSSQVGQWEAARATRPGVLGQLDRGLGRMSLLSRHRSALRDPRSWGALVVGTPAARIDDTPLDQLLDPPNNVTSRVGEEELAAEIARFKRMLPRFSVATPEWESFVSTLDELQARGVEVVVVIMPVPIEYIEAHPRGSVDFDAFRSSVALAVDERGIPLFDYSHTAEASDFRDLSHLLAGPARRFSMSLADDLAGLGW